MYFKNCKLDLRKQKKNLKNSFYQYKSNYWGYNVVETNNSELSVKRQKHYTQYKQNKYCHNKTGNIFLMVYSQMVNNIWTSVLKINPQS